jgi:DNA invertase Pin-like site-specific DNA recombinase
MTASDLLPASVLQRKAIVYVRQSTPMQVQVNLESQRRQYDLVEVARQRGFRQIQVIDDDLGRSASGAMERPGFDRLVAQLCAGTIGAVLCLDASRLARNGRDWHHLLELCGLVEARVIDLDGVYNPCLPNDRPLLGMKGSISEFELGILRARLVDAARSKARRGELRIPVPIGFVWDREAGLGFDPDVRIQKVIRLIFSKFRELGSARQVLLWMRAEGIHFPRPSDGKKTVSFEWHLPRYAPAALQERHLGPQESVLCRRLRLWQKPETNRDRQWPGAYDLQAWQAARAVGGFAHGSSRGLYQLGRLRAQPDAAGRQRVRQGRRREVGARRVCAAGGPAEVCPLRPPAARRLSRARARDGEVSL